MYYFFICFTYPPTATKKLNHPLVVGCVYVPMESEILRLPVGLLDSLKTHCFNIDRRFLSSVSRITSIPVENLRKRILGSGAQVPIFVDKEPWWTSTQCASMEVEGLLWKRCGSVSESNGYCWKHRDGKTMRYDDTQFQKQSLLKPYRLNGAVVWVAKDGTVRDRNGSILKEWTLDISNGHAYHSSRVRMDRTGTAVTAATEAKAAAEAEAEAEGEAEADES